MRLSVVKSTQPTLSFDDFDGFLFVSIILIELSLFCMHIYMATYMATVYMRKIKMGLFL